MIKLENKCQLKKEKAEKEKAEKEVERENYQRGLPTGITK